MGDVLAMPTLTTRPLPLLSCMTNPDGAAVGYSFTKALQVGVQVFFLNQCTDDTVNGQPVNGDGFRGSARGIGPQLRGDWSPGFSLVCKYQHEMSVRNRPQGERFWMEVSVPFT